MHINKIKWLEEYVYASVPPKIPAQFPQHLVLPPSRYINYPTLIRLSPSHVIPSPIPDPGHRIPQIKTYVCFAAPVLVIACPWDRTATIA